MIFKVKEDLTINQGEVIYIKKDLSFDFNPIHSADYSLLIGYISLSFDSETKCACQVWGCNPINVWVNKELSKPKSIKGDLLLDDEIEAGDNRRLIEAGVWITYFDKSNGWVCIGNYKDRKSVV
jgi:hypothetical protein